MRTLLKNKRPCRYAIPIGEEIEKDEWGNETSEIKIIYGDPEQLSVNYSAGVGEEAIEVFGSTTDYSRTLVFAEKCPLSEGAKLWIDSEVANYKVTKVADSKNGYMVAIKEI